MQAEAGAHMCTRHKHRRHKAAELPVATAEGAGQNLHSQAQCTVRR